WPARDDIIGNPLVPAGGSSRIIRTVRAVVVALGVAIASPVSAATIHGLVYDDTNGDGAPTAGEPGIANAVVALGVKTFVVTDASGQFDIDAGTATQGDRKSV